MMAKLMTKVLDHGYIGLIEAWGSDVRIIESARMSTRKGFLGWDAGPCPECAGAGFVVGDKRVQTLPPAVSGTYFFPGEHHFERGSIPCHACEGKGQIAGDQKLLKFLYDKKHSSPFEFAGLTVEIQAPIMVYREWHRHRTQSYSEMSARYTPLPDSNYIPTPERCLIVSGKNKQAGKVAGSEELTHESVLEWLALLDGAYRFSEAVYQDGLRRGIPKELARLPVPVGRYSRMRATGNLRNWLLFLTLRRDAGAQWEIRQFANILGDEIIAKEFPRTWEVFIGPEQIAA